MVRRVFVEKKKGFAVEADGLCQDWKINLHLPGLRCLRLLSRYDVEGIDDETFAAAKDVVFSEPPLDDIWEETLVLEDGVKYFAMEFLPGQFDQRADSAEQCIRLLRADAVPRIRCARVYLMEGDLTDLEVHKIKEYTINPVDSREADWKKPERLYQDATQPGPVARINHFIQWGEKELGAYRQELGLAMSQADLSFVQSYFRDTEQRDPSLTELRVIDTYWSDHCRHTTFMTALKEIQFQEGAYADRVKATYATYLSLKKALYGQQERETSLMDLAVIGAKWLRSQGKAEDLDLSEEVNACSIKTKAKISGIEEDWLVMFKNETHNHPTEIEPFGGAATCLGGAIRDPLSGRVYVHQAMRVTGSGDPRTPIEETLPGKLSQRQITKGAARGYSSYGNQIGLATGQVTEIYHEGYIAKRMEVGAVIGAVPASHVARSTPQPGDAIVLVGGRTGRDGCGGATGSSKEHTEDSIKESGAEVQKGNPPVERNIQRLFRRKEAASLIKRCNDFGAGGVSVAVGELADGIDVDLDLVRKKYEGLDGTELAISESQERMAVVLSPEDVEVFLHFAEEENLEAYVIAKVTDTGRFRMTWRGDQILDLSRAFLDTNGVRQEAVAFIPNREVITKSSVASFDLNTCSQQGLLETFDSTIGAGTVLMPLGGKHQLTPAMGMAATLPVTEGETDTATLMTFGYDPYLSSQSPYLGAYYAVVDSLTRLTAMGGDSAQARLSFQEYFERMSTDPECWGKPLEALLGALEAQLTLEVPAIGGKDSMSGTFLDRKVPPTLISFAVGVADAKQLISPEFKEADRPILLVRARKLADGLLDPVSYRRDMARVHELILAGHVDAASTIGMGGMFVAVSKMAFGNQIGARLDGIGALDLHQPEYGSLLITLKDSNDLGVLTNDLGWQRIGTTVKEATLTFGTQDSYRLDDLLAKWKAPLSSVFPTDAEQGMPHPRMEQIRCATRSNLRPAVTIARPRVLIPTFPGTNCEMDSKRAFDQAGAKTRIQLIRNLDQRMLAESMEELELQIRKSQILMLPGGFSGGDEPDGSAKFIVSVFRNPRIQEAVSDLLEQRDGLILGICNGFQALIKLGLVPYGTIVETSKDHPTLTYNTIGRHVSRLVRTRITSVKSPWLAGTELDQVHLIPISHGEGRFIISDSLLDQLIANGQVATQYVGLSGLPSNSIEVNPNGSVAAIEGITSPDGRVFGKMAHSERIGKHLYRNVPGETDQRLFASGVAYFS